MAHITFANKQSSKPVLQFYSEQRDEMRRVAIEQSPFRIGRCETADLRIDSAQISREHAEVYERGGCWFIRDLGSTNGTDVNGQTVASTVLRDGDVIRFVDIELTFIDSTATPFQRMATQPAVKAPTARPLVGLPAELIAARKGMEATLHQTQPVEFQEIRSVRASQVEALVALPGRLAGVEEIDGQRLSHPTWDFADELYRRRAVETAGRIAGVKRLLVSVDCQGIQHPQMLAGTFESLRHLTPAGWQLGVAVSTSEVLDRWKLDDLARLAREFDLLLVFKDFEGAAPQVNQLEPCAVEYLLLSSRMCEGFENSRQPARRLESVVAVCEQLDIRPVLPMGSGAPPADLCREFGIDLVLSHLRGGPGVNPPVHATSELTAV